MSDNKWLHLYETQKNKNSSFVVESKHTKRIKRQNLALNEESPLKGMSQTLDFTLLDSLHKVRRVLVLNIDHLLIHLFGAHFAPKHGRGSEIVDVGLRHTSCSSRPTFVESVQGTVRARCCWDQREVRRAKPTMKKWRRRKGIRFTANLRRSELS